MEVGLPLFWRHGYGTKLRNCRAYFSVYYYTKCVLLKAGHATLKTKTCNIKLATQTIAYIIWCKTVADALKINVLNTKISSASGGLRTPDPHRGLCPLDSRWRLCPQTPVIGSRSRAHHRCVYYLKILRIDSAPLSVTLCVAATCCRFARRVVMERSWQLLLLLLMVAVTLTTAASSSSSLSYDYATTAGRDNDTTAAAAAVESSSSAAWITNNVTTASVDDDNATTAQMTTDPPSVSYWQWDATVRWFTYAPPFIIFFATVGNTFSIVTLQNPTFR